jgi:hypothetical protein
MESTGSIQNGTLMSENDRDLLASLPAGDNSLPAGLRSE